MPYPGYLRIGVTCIALTLSIIYGLQGNDFFIFLNAAAKLARHIDIYNGPSHQEMQYYYSPLFALLLVPFTVLPFSITASAWVLFCFYLIYRIWLLTEGYLCPIMLPASRQKAWLLLSLFYIFNMAMYNISCLQLTIFLVWATLQSLRYFESGKNVAGSLLLALIINIKVMPVLFLPYLLYRNYRSGFVYTIAFYLLFLFLPALFIGTEYNWQLLGSWWQTINPSNAEHLLESHKLLHSLVSTIPPYLTATSNELNLKINFIDISLQNAERVCTAVRVFFVLLTLAFLGGRPFTKADNKLHVYREVSYLLLITPLIFPHQGKYSYFYLFPAFIYLIYFLVSAKQTVLTNRKHQFLQCYLFTVSIIFIPLIGRDILGDYIFDWLQLYRIQVICTVLLIPALLVCTPTRLAKLQQDDR